MLVREIQGNINSAPLPSVTHVEIVTLPSEDLVKRIQRVRTDHEREVGIRLAADAPILKDGDILSLSDQNAIIVRVAATDVLVIRPRSTMEMGVVAHALGNRHLQAQFFGTESEYGADVMVVQHDHTVAQYLDSTGVPYSRDERVMPVPFRHSKHTH